MSSVIHTVLLDLHLFTFNAPGHQGELICEGSRVSSSPLMPIGTEILL